MINHTHTRIEQARPMPLHSDYLTQTGVTQIVEGMALINSMEDGIGRVRPSTGVAANGSFLGFSAEINRRQTQAVAVEEGTVPTGGGTVALQHPAISADIAAYDPTGALIAVTNGAASATNIKWGASNTAGADPTGADRANLVFHSSDAGQQFTFVYRYSPTMEESIVLFGDGNVQGVSSPGEAANVMTVITKGVVFTDQFDTSANWTSVDITTLHSQANGLIGQAGGEAVTAGRIQVVQAPSVTVPFLGLLLL